MTNSSGRNKEAERNGHSKMIVSHEARRSTRKVASMEDPFRSIHQDNQDCAHERGRGISKNFPGDSLLKSRVGSRRVITELSLLYSWRSWASQ